MKTTFKNEISSLSEMMIHLPWENRKFYISFLTQTYYFVQHSTRLLALAAAHASLEEDSLHRRYSAHIAEEKGHEKIALNDLKKLGVENLEAKSITAKNLYETQYFKIEREHPASLFGYILALEGIASLICPLFIEKVYRAHGTESSRFLKLHVEEDPDHVDKALEAIASLPAQLQLLIQDNMRQSVRNYRALLEECVIQSQQVSQQTSVENYSEQLVN
ncbi:iron-containing redox enzyme family protein [Pseudobdellovibrio exovorus]|uniref:Iron-containing redox enzyme family protein n=1 Tax=Pseudobdellovibrio exovorus JSS TaxID=1184267 RepID=M4V9F0_9BACT|nr:iron-containing redox enzyme family protein [Pseudobdellovibrio exovorus]AGH96007.1 hypothetical protein A11Q_1791 [Pseudobdellovibrio exovorus JSS]